jgi:hypothetical protein
MMFDMPQINTEGRHPSIQEVAQFFDYEHLPTPLKEFSQQCYDLAANMIADLPDSPQLTIGLQKLLEAKDAFVRASMRASDEQVRAGHERRKQAIIEQADVFRGAWESTDGS